jgi:hypothetical protein
MLNQEFREQINRYNPGRQRACITTPPVATPKVPIMFLPGKNRTDTHKTSQQAQTEKI